MSMFRWEVMAQQGLDVPPDVFRHGLDATRGINDFHTHWFICCNGIIASLDPLEELTVGLLKTVALDAAT